MIEWGELAAGHQSPEIDRLEDGVHHVRVLRSRLLDSEIVATAAVVTAATGDGVHTRGKVERHGRPARS